jgi:hypothetical protein
MAEYEKKHGDFVLFIAKNRKTDKSPSHTGSIFLSGKTYNLAAWEKISKNGNVFMSGRVGDEVDENGQTKYQKMSQPQNSPSYAKTSSKHDLDDEIPF